MAQDSSSVDSVDLSDTATLLDYELFKAERPLGYYMGRNERNGTTLFSGRKLHIMLLLYKRGVWFYAKRAGVDPVRLMNLKSMEKYRGKRPKLKEFVYIGSELFAVAEFRRKGSRYLLLQGLNINTGRLVGKPKVLVRQKVRGLKYHNKFDYDFYPTPSGSKIGLVYERTSKKTRRKGDKKYILIDEDMNKVGKRTLKQYTRSAFNRKEKVSNKKIIKYNILNDGTLYSDVSKEIKKGDKLSLNDPSLLVYPIDTSYVVNVRLKMEQNDTAESQLGNIHWWHSDTTYSALGIKYSVSNTKEKTLTQELVLTNSLSLNDKETSWTTLDYPIDGNLEAIDINTYEVDGYRVAIINHYAHEVIKTVDKNGYMKTSTRYRLTKTNVLGLEDNGHVAWSHPIDLGYNYYTYNIHSNPYVLFHQNHQFYFVRHVREYLSVIPIRTFYKIHRLNTANGAVRYEKKQMPNRTPKMTNEGNGLNYGTVSAHRTRILQLFHSKKVYEFSVR